MNRTENFEANVRFFVEYLRDHFPGAEIATYFKNSADTVGFDRDAHTFRVDTGEKIHIARAARQLLTDWSNRYFAEYLDRWDLAEKLRSVRVEHGWLLLKRPSPLSRQQEGPKSGESKSIEAWGRLMSQAQAYSLSTAGGDRRQRGGDG